MQWRSWHDISGGAVLYDVTSPRTHHHTHFGQHGGSVVSTVAAQYEGPGIESRSAGPFCVEFTCSPRACVGFLRVLRFPPTTKDM